MVYWKPSKLSSESSNHKDWEKSHRKNNKHVYMITAQKSLVSIFLIHVSWVQSQLEMVLGNAFDLFFNNCWYYLGCFFFHQPTVLSEWKDICLHREIPKMTCTNQHIFPIIDFCNWMNESFDHCCWMFHQTRWKYFSQWKRIINSSISAWIGFDDTKNHSDQFQRHSKVLPLIHLNQFLLHLSWTLGPKISYHKRQIFTIFEASFLNWMIYSKWW